MINIKCEEVLKLISQLEAKIVPTGIMFLFIENRTIKWKVNSQKFDIDIFKEGSSVSETAIAVRAMNEGKILNEKIPREKYGQRLITIAIPLVDDSDAPIGAFSIVLPRLHPVAASFPNFAPIVAELFPEGAFLYMSDLTKIAYVQGSKKFNLSNMHVGYELKETDIAYQTIHSVKAQVREIDAERYGIPVYIANHPLYDEDTGKNIVATLGVVVPKSASSKLKGIAGNLSTSLNGIAATVEQLASSATNIHENGQNLYNHISSVSEVLDKINSISEFISSVANQSNMLGLNASIEAARAGEMGRGFSVVANEIRQLSTQSKETVPQIKVLTEEIKNKINEINKESSESLAASEEQASATEEISASVEELSAMANELENIAKDL
ncbi:chemotaxis protein [Clostridium carboxidivorans P7]|uniref:Methyl-accepting chemotaxis sensory transducer n=1 Tax=Clostridium carboxidivorans P7 TaxID=536227 RepID=C6PRS4_9CLOT|nr:methyl-accepting chemotaxis protein [Clostridium carboxidivorans]AKN31009.1 chemotaxis protein [Clostridium carboxidivorans P7]EET88117.1 methyl-accepting chemotaxis sensory transducer [Clostridium carboxidivorans P7]EFG88732.1 methyl-accepting chemotaxis protein signaling domain protein [Clostridium carboxidivorans P7]